MTIYETLNKVYGNYKKWEGDIGLEIETESREEYSVPKFAFWDAHTDGSLRNFGIEYVLKAPLDFKTSFPKALDEFQEKTKGINFIQDSITTSVHTHLNFLNDTFITLGNFLTAYTLTENLLIRFSGPERLSNNFCLPMVDAEETYINIMNMLAGLGKKNWSAISFEPERTKYGAINISALRNFGSLEIRSFRGTTDINTIKQWVGILNSLQTYAREPNLLPPQIILKYQKEGPEILNDIFGSENRKLIAHKDEKQLMEETFWYAANIAYSVKDWTVFNDLPKKKKVKSKDLDITSMTLYGQPFESLSQAQQRKVLIEAGHNVEIEKDERNPLDEALERAQEIIRRTRDEVEATNREERTRDWFDGQAVNPTTAAFDPEPDFDPDHDPLDD